MEITKLDALSILLPTNNDRLFVLCKADNCDVYYPVKRITKDNEKQTQYMSALKDFYQEMIDETNT